MTTRTEQQLAVITERLIVHIGSNSVRTGFLFRKSYIVIYTVFLGIDSCFVCHQVFEQAAMFRRNGKMHIDFSILVSSIESTFHKMFFQWSTASIFISVEFQQTFRKRTIIQSCRLKQCSHYSFIITLSHQCGNVLLECFLTGGIQVIIESKLFNLLKECFFEFSFGHIIISPKKFE